MATNSQTEFELLNALKRDQQLMEEQIKRWREWWTERKEFGAPHLGEMADRLIRVRDLLLQHYDREEQASVLRAGSAAEPLTAEGQRLEKEHAQLLGDLEHLIGLLSECCTTSSLCWGEAGRRFESFLEKLQAHEKQEQAFLASRQLLQGEADSYRP